MFARNVSMSLKPNSVPEFTLKLERGVLPLLRKQQGFWGLIAFVSQDGSEAIGVILWDQKENADAYGRRTYRKVLKVLSNVIEGTPQAQACEVSNTTLRMMEGWKALAKEREKIAQLEIHEVSRSAFHKLAAPLPA